MTFSFSLADLPALPPGEAIFSCALASLGLFILAGGLFGPLLAVCCEISGQAGKRMLPIKAARHIAGMSLVFGTVICLLTGAALHHLFRIAPDPLFSLYALPLQITAGAMAAAEILLLLYVSTWPGKGMTGAAHAFCGALCWLCALLAMYLGCAFLFQLTHGAPPEPEAAMPWRQMRDFFLIPAASFAWPLLGQIAALALAAAGAMAACWILLTRARSDHGRDYYMFALPYAAKWALAGGLVSLPVMFFAYARVQEIMLPELSHEPSPPLVALCYALPALACLFWLPLVKSATPLRHKPGIVLALLLLGAGIGAQFLALNKVLPSP